jgi:hypothetical protein
LVINQALKGDFRCFFLVQSSVVRLYYSS